MKCLMKYEWVKLPRDLLPRGEGTLGLWARLASRAAFRTGKARYCGNINEVSAGGWSGGIVGLKSILGEKQKGKALAIVEKLAEQGYLQYQLDKKTKRFDYQITDWVSQYCGQPCEAGAICATEGYGFFCLPRSLPERLVERGHRFEESDAWLDLWCHTVWQEPDNAFSFMAPTIQYGRYSCALTLEGLGARWGWEKTKVWRFFHKHQDTFALRKLASSYGCIIFNRCYPTGEVVSLPPDTYLARLTEYLCRQVVRIHKSMSENERLNRLVAMFSEDFVALLRVAKKAKNRVARLYIRAYLSHCTRVETIKYDCRNRTIAFLRQCRLRCVRCRRRPMLC